MREHVAFALNYVKQRFNVDENRVIIAGDSDGGRGAYAMAETEATFYAAAIPVIGAPGGVTRYANLRNLPWFAINGDKDSIFKIDGVRRSVEQMKAIGIDLTWKLVEGGGHDPFFFKTYKKDVCKFIVEHPRKPLPLIVDWTIDPAKAGYETGFPANTFRWIRIDKAGETRSKTSFGDSGGLIRGGHARIRAKKVENENVVEVETSGVAEFTLLVSDDMFDLDKEIEIKLNGKPVYKSRVNCDARIALEEARNFNDRALVFCNRVTIEVDNPPGVKEDTGEGGE